MAMRLRAGDIANCERGPSWQWSKQLVDSPQGSEHARRTLIKKSGSARSFRTPSLLQANVVADDTFWLHSNDRRR